MQRVIKLNRKGITKLKEMISDLTIGMIAACPYWSTYIEYGLHKYNNANDCTICYAMFPKVIGMNAQCPCYNYTKKYLIKRLNEIIKYNEGD